MELILRSIRLSTSFIAWVGMRPIASRHPAKSLERYETGVMHEAAAHGIPRIERRKATRLTVDSNHDFFACFGRLTAHPVAFVLQDAQAIRNRGLIFPLERAAFES